MGLTLLTEPTLDPVTVDEAREHLRAGGPDDGYIAGLVLAARALVENDTRRALITQTWQLTIDDGWPEHRRQTPRNVDGAGYYGGGSAAFGGSVSRSWRYRIVVPRPPLQSVISIRYVDVTGVTQTLDPSQYQVAKSNTGEWVIEPPPGVVWPVVRQQLDAITVVFVAGYGDGPGSIPEPLRVAMLLLIGQWYDNRNTLNLISRSGSIQELPNATAALIQRYRVMY